jgi:hypothetical protein
MENDSIRASGNNTLVDIWIDGKLRAIAVTKEAIEANVGFDRAERMTEDGRCEFVRANLPLVVASVRARLRDANPTADSVIIDAGQLSASAERRKGERRSSERRRAAKSKEELPHGERRRTERRKTDRRRSPKKPG